MLLLAKLRTPTIASLLSLLLVIAAERPAAAQTLLAQTSMGKMALGWLLTLVAIAIGLLVVLRPNSRSLKEKKQRPPAK